MTDSSTAESDDVRRYPWHRDNLLYIIILAVAGGKLQKSGNHSRNTEITPVIRKEAFNEIHSSIVVINGDHCRIRYIPEILRQF